MGLDMTYQAVPDPCVLIERSLKDSEFGELLQFLPGLYKRGAAGWQDGIRLEFWQLAGELAKQSPGLEKRNCYVGRRWDDLHYLLSANRRKEQGDEKDVLLDKAIHGNKLGDLAGTQGMPIGYVSHSEVSQIAGLLEPLTPADLRAHYLPEKMQAQNVYKFFEPRADDDDWKFTSEAFKTFRTFYLEAAAAKEGALTILD